MTATPELAPKVELMRSLGRLVRGLSALFWGLPLALLICIKTAFNEWLRLLDIAPPMLATGLLFYGLLQLSYFQPQERVWHHALDRAKILSLVNFSLSPFLYFWNQKPGESFFAHAVGLLALSSVIFLFNLNLVIARLAAMLPDETVRSDTKIFTALNRYLLITTIVLIATYYTLYQITSVPQFINQLRGTNLPWPTLVLLILVLLPMAMTMTLVWKIKELILSSVFDAQVLAPQATN
jgi:hypothetical protein